MSDRIFVVPYDFSASSRAALSAAAGLGRRVNASLHLIHVIEPPKYACGYADMGASAMPPPVDIEEIRAAAMRSLREVAGATRALGGEAEVHVIEGSGIADMIAEYAKTVAADLIIICTRGRTGVARALLGSVAERTLRCASCPVLTVPSRPEA